jgi:hypothetical protein
MSKPTELLKQFTCTSSLILLTHPQLTIDTRGYFEILKIFDSKGVEVWSAGQPAIIVDENNPNNEKNIDMATYDIVFKKQEKLTITKLKEMFSDKDIFIKTTEKYQYSITDIRVSKQIHPDDLLEKYPELVTKELHEGKTFENPGVLISKELVKLPTLPHTKEVILENKVKLSGYKDYDDIEKVIIKYVPEIKSVPSN